MFLCFVNAKAYSTDRYEIDIPNSYINDKEGSFSLKNNEKNTTIDIIVNKNINKIDVDSLNEDDLTKDKYLSTIENELKKTNNSLVINQYNLSLYKINNHNSILFEIQAVSNNKYNSIVYQNQYITSSKNYIYFVVISSSNKDDLNSSEIKDIVNSFKMKDDFFNHKQKMKKYYIITAGIIIIWIIAFTLIIINKKKKK